MEEKFFEFTATVRVAIIEDFYWLELRKDGKIVAHDGMVFDVSPEDLKAFKVFLTEQLWGEPTKGE